MFEYVGVIHVHSIFSDGTGTVHEIAEAANEVNLDYLILTDHNTLRALNEGYEKWHGDTLLLVGVEINDRQNKNHYLAMNVKKTFSTRLKAKEYVRLVKEEGGIGFMAHPFEERQNLPQYPPYPWEEWDTDDFTGIEIWNHMSEWMENLTEENKLQLALHPLKYIIAPSKKALSKWDEIAQRRPVTAIGGVDAHAHKVNVLGLFEFEIFPYKVLFKSIRTHVLLDNPLKKTTFSHGIEKAKASIYKALENGSCFISNYYHGDARGFRFFAETENGKFEQGATIFYRNDIKLVATLPEQAEIRLIANGKEILRKQKTAFLEFTVTFPGVYRVEVYKREKGWIFSNHIRIIS